MVIYVSISPIGLAVTGGCGDGEILSGCVASDGKIEVAGRKIPDHPGRVVVTILDEPTEAGEDLSGLGDYLDQLTDYEDRLARGEVRWM